MTNDVNALTPEHSPKDVNVPEKDSVLYMDRQHPFLQGWRRHHWATLIQIHGRSISGTGRDLSVAESNVSHKLSTAQPER